ncbi:hybrid sensor histidine kinase/response regulator [Bosea massiliensis]|jgi:signal transduction histidine kinase/CheY-like chemotaxis protein|uniref:histidine kinase n=2 Tax=Bosea TaxID=85413 RepID=A0ABW0P1R2_9HYPH
MREHRVTGRLTATTIAPTVREADEAALRREQIDEVFRMVIPGVAGAGLAALILAVFLVALGASDPRTASIWAACVLTCAVAHTLLALGYRRADCVVRAASTWPLAFTVVAGLEGIAWGFAPVGLTPDAPFDIRFLPLAVTLGVTAGAIPAFGPWLPAFLALFLPATLPYVAANFFAPALVERASAFLMLIYVVVMGGLGVRSHRAFIEIVGLRLRSEALAEDLRRERDTADAANRAKSSFLAAASHDLRQPVHALGLFAGALLRLDLPGEARLLVERIEASAAAMDGLFNAILDISRLDAGVVEVAPRAFRVGPYLARICRDLRPEAEAKGLRLRCRSCDEVAWTDPFLLERVVRNLVSNAVRYSDRGGVLVACRRRGGRLAIQVFDTGPGIAAGDHERIFQEYVQIGNVERDRTKGLGLGLAIVRRTCAILDMPIALRSRIGRGSCFEVKMALSDEAALAEDSVAAAPGALAERSLIVVIDDEASIREAMERLLAGWGHDVIAAGSGDEAVARLASHPTRPDLIVSDYRLRDGETGTEVIERLRSEFNETIPALIITGDTAPDRLIEARTSGLVLLHKPVPNGKLRAAMRNLMVGARASSGE